MWALKWSHSKITSSLPTPIFSRPRPNDIIIVNLSPKLLPWRCHKGSKWQCCHRGVLPTSLHGTNKRLDIWEQLKTENQCKVARGTRVSSCNFPGLQTWKTEKQQAYSEKECMKWTNFIRYRNSSPQWTGMRLRAGSHPGDSEAVCWATSLACSRLSVLGRPCSLASENLQISVRGRDNARSTQETLPPTKRACLCFSHWHKFLCPSKDLIDTPEFTQPVFYLSFLFLANSL